MDFTNKYGPFTNTYDISNNKKCIILVAYQPFD